MLRFLLNMNTCVFWCDAVFCVLYFVSIYNNLSDDVLQKAKRTSKKVDIAGFAATIVALAIAFIAPLFNIILLYLFVFKFAELRDEAVKNVIEVIENGKF